MPEPRAILAQCFAAGVAAVEPAAAVRRHLVREGDALVLGAERLALADVDRVVVIGAGKASAPMAQAVEELLGTRVRGGVVVVKHGHGVPLRAVRLHEAAHPVPDAAGEAGARALETAVAGLGPRDLVLAVISGGASALMPAPRAGLTLADLQAVTRLLLASGAPIADMNAVRKHVSRLAGGQLARRVAPARLWTLVLSDVVGDDLAAIASGPTVPDPTTFADVAAIVGRHGFADRLPPAVAALLARGVRGEEPETAKPGEACFARACTAIVGSNRLALTAAAEAARVLGVEPVVIDAPLTGEARTAAAAFCRRALTIAAGAGRPRLLLAGGEVTVTLGERPGRGGRAQEFALAAALALSGNAGISVLAAGSDGSDGPTDAAGAFADGATCARAAARALDARDHLARHDAYPFLAALGDLHVTGPTRTNVMDLYLALVG